MNNIPVFICHEFLFGISLLLLDLDPVSVTYYMGSDQMGAGIKTYWPVKMVLDFAADC